MVYKLRKINPELYKDYTPDFVINGYDLYLTCYACPEQYDVIKDGYMVGYLRLRHGIFRVSCPEVGDAIVYESYPKGDGIFHEDEREEYLHNAVAAIDFYIKTHLLID